MADVSVGYDGLNRAATSLQTGQGEINDKLQSLKSMVDQLVASEFRTQLASGTFLESYQQWTTGAQNMIQGLEGMASYLRGRFVTL